MPTNDSKPSATLPREIRVEVKFTTQETLQLPSREIKILIRSSGNDSIGIIAALFRTGDWETDGKWIVSDASSLSAHTRALSAGSASAPGSAPGSASASASTSASAEAPVSASASASAPASAAASSPGAPDTFNIKRERLIRLTRDQTSLDPIRTSLTTHWPGLLYAFHLPAMEGLEFLHAALDAAHEVQQLPDRLPTHEISNLEHRERIDALLAHHGEQNLGRLLQVFLGYSFSLLGYQRITINQTGVPDVFIEALSDGRPLLPEVGPKTEEPLCLGPFTMTEARRVLASCERANESDLAARIKAQLETPGR